MDEAILVDLAGLIERHPWWTARAALTLKLLDRLGVRPPARVLDAGCGWGVTLSALERRGHEAVGLDVSRRALERLDAPGRSLVEADLTGGFPAQPIAGATVTFKSGNATVCSGKTDAKGHAQCSQNLLNALLTPLKGTLTATFAGDLNWLGSSGTASLIQKS